MKKYKKHLAIIFIVMAFLVSLCFIPINANKLIPLVEKQVSRELGVDIHIERLILRVGPYIKLKAPLMHVMYNDGKKFAQLDNVKFYIPWTSFIKDKTNIKKLYANKLNIRLTSDDKQFGEFLSNLENKELKDTPNIQLKEYVITCHNLKNNDKYSLSGNNLFLEKIVNTQNFKIKTSGNLFINQKKYINYDLNIVPKIDLPEKFTKFDLIELAEQVKNLDFTSDIIADLKLYKNANDIIQASGFINVDNISVLDFEKKNPKSFVYLTLWGDKASILSNIYTSINKKIYVEGSVNNSKKPVLDIKVKTDEIELKDLYQKLRIVTDLSNLKGVNSVNGTMNANFTLKGDLNKIKSNGYLKIADAEIKASGIEVEKINSEIDFSNNKINIVNATGYVNNAPILAKGSIDKNINIELLMNKVDAKYLCPSSFGVKDGKLSLVANLTGSLDNIEHKENVQIENLAIDNNGINASLESFRYDTNKNNTAYINNIIIDTPTTETIKIPSMKLLIDGDNIKTPDTNIYMQNSLLTLKSELCNYNNKDYSFNASLKGFINSKDIKPINKTSTRYPLQIAFFGNKTSQNINSQILFEKTSVLDEPTVLNLVSKLEKSSLKIDELSLVSFTGKFSDDFKSNIKGAKKVLISGNVDDFKTPTFKNLRIFIPQIINLNIFDTLAQIKGDVFLNGKLNTPEIIGQLQIQNLFNQQMKISLSNTSVDFNKNTAIINIPQFKIADSSMSINASLLTDFSKNLLVNYLNIKSKYLNLDTLLMYKDSPILRQYPVTIKEGKFYSEKLLANIYGSSLYLSAFSSDLNLNNDILTLKNISSELFNGKIGGSLNYNLKDEHYHSEIMGRGISASPIFDIISNRKDSISGTMDFDTNLKGELTSKQSLNGDIKFAVTNGRMSTLGKLEHLLYAQNVVADNMLRTSLSVVTKAITLKDTGLFKYLRGDIYLENGIANIKMLQSQGPLMALFIKGNFNTINDFAQLVVLGRLSDEVINGLGAFGEFSFNKLLVMLTGEDKKFNILPEDFDKLPQLPIKNTKEFRSIINGNIDKSSSVVLFNWISYSEKSLKQKEVPMTNIKVPDFINELPY